MSGWAISLRHKAALALALATLVALLPVALIGWQVVSQVQDYMGRAYADNLTQLSRLQILSPVLQDLRLAQRFAGSTVVQEWLQAETDPALKDRFFREAAGYRADFSGHTWFVVSESSRNYYYNARGEPDSRQARYRLSEDKASDRWYFNLSDSVDNFNINVNHDEALGTTRVWINVPIRDQGQYLGLAGTGLDLTRFIEDFLSGTEAGVTPLIIDGSGAIQAHPDKSRIALGSGAGVSRGEHNFFDGLAEDDRQQLQQALQRAATDPTVTRLLNVRLDGQPRLLGLAYMPELDWYLVTAIDLGVAQSLDARWWLAIGATIVLLMALMAGAMAVAVNRLLIRPLNRLQGSAREISRGNFAVALPSASRDELGALTRAFGTMIGKIQSHTEELESRVKARTRELENSHREVAQMHKTVNDSIDYASLIQRAILPDSAIHQVLGADCFILWEPRDVVGGDFYFFHSEQDWHLLGLVDCAGHGVPGALMTMLARAAFDHAIRECGIRSPAALLQQTDTILRHMLQDLDLPRALATNMDAALVVFNKPEQTLVFAGAKIPLFIQRGHQVDLIKPGNRPLVARKRGVYQDHSFSVQPGDCYCITTDGLLDQSGGEHGFGMGSSGFIRQLQALQHLPISERGDALREYLQAYRGDRPVRDDIGVIGFSL